MKEIIIAFLIIAPAVAAILLPMILLWHYKRTVTAGQTPKTVSIGQIGAIFTGGYVVSAAIVAILGLISLPIPSFFDSTSTPTLTLQSSTAASTGAVLTTHIMTPTSIGTDTPTQTSAPAATSTVEATLTPTVSSTLTQTPIPTATLEPTQVFTAIATIATTPSPTYSPESVQVGDTVYRANEQLVNTLLHVSAPWSAIQYWCGQTIADLNRTLRKPKLDNYQPKNGRIEAKYIPLTSPQIFRNPLDSTQWILIQDEDWEYTYAPSSSTSGAEEKDCDPSRTYTYKVEKRNGEFCVVEYSGLSIPRPASPPQTANPCSQAR